MDVQPDNQNETQNYKSLYFLVIVGPSGVGKGTLIGKLLAEFKNSICLSVSHTTRAPRPGEVDGVNYHYISKEQFEKMIFEDRFVEYNRYSDNLYGTSKDELLKWGKENKICVLEIDINGARNIIKNNLSAHYIGILPPTFDDLKVRILSRNKEAEEVVNKRLEIAKYEIEEIEKSDFFEFKIVNDDLEKCYLEFKQCIFTMYPHLKDQ